MWKIFNKKSENDNKQENTGSKSAQVLDSKKKKTAKIVKKETVNTKKTDSASSLEKAHTVFLKPLVTEKLAHAAEFNTYAFVVSKKSNKIEIKKAFSEIYNIMPLSVNIVNMPAKAKNFKRIPGFRPAWKKAIIRLPKDKKINIVENV